MKKRIISLILAVLMLAGVSVTAFAADHQIVYDVAYNSDKNVVTVTLFIENAVGLEAADLSLAYDTTMYEYVDCVEASISDNAMIVAGKAETDDGLATCSVIFMEACEAADLNAEGRLELVTFTFMPRSAEYDLDDFCYWAGSYSVGGASVVGDVNIVGKQELMEDLTDAVTYIMTTSPSANTTKGGTQGISGDLSSKWYVYVIAGVIAVGAIAGIAVVAMRSSHNEDEAEESAEETKKDSKKESKAETKAESKDETKAESDEKAEKDSEE